MKKGENSTMISFKEQKLACLFTIIFVCIINPLPEVRGLASPKTKRQGSININDPPQRTSAVFYESPNKEGRRHAFRDSIMGWQNLPGILAEEQVSPALLCASGAWLIYGQPDFKKGDDGPVSLLSGNQNCVDPAKIPAIGSMQPISTTTFSSGGTISIFTKANFGSHAHIISADESKSAGVKQLSEPVAPIGSVAVVGEDPWSLISSRGQVLCVRPQPSGKIQSSLPVCYGLNLMQAQVDGFQVDAAYPGCPDEHDESVVANLRLSDCVEFGVGNAVPLKKSEAQGRSMGENPVKLECKTNNRTASKSITFSEEEKALIMKLLNIRLTHDFSSDVQLLWPDDRKDIWRAVPLDTAFDIFIASVPGNVVNLKYLRIIREFTMYHLNEVWKSMEADKKNKTWKDHKVISFLLGRCLKIVEGNQEHYKSLISSEYNSRTTLDQFLAKIHPSFSMNPEKDPVIETAWVVANYAMAVCHEAFKYQVNFWDNFVASFQQLYFMPLGDRWRTPQISPEVFRVVLSGFGTEGQYKRIAFATSQALELTPNLQPFEA